MERSVSTFWGLLDISFSRFVTENVIKVLYIIAVALAVVAAIVAVFTAFANYGVSQGIGALLLSPVVLFFYVILIRVVFEIFIVIFRIADYLKVMADNVEGLAEASE